MLAGQAAFLGGRARGGAQEIGNPGQVLLALEFENVALLVRKHILAEGRAQRCKPLVDLRQSCLGGRIKRGTGALEHEVIAIEHALLLGIEAEIAAANMQRIDAQEQRLIQQDGIPVPGA